MARKFESSKSLDLLLLASLAHLKGNTAVAASAFDRAMRSHDIVPTLVGLDKLNSDDFDLPGGSQDTDSVLDTEDWDEDPDDVRDRRLDWDQSMPGGRPTDAFSMPWDTEEEEDDRTDPDSTGMRRSHASLEDAEDLESFVAAALEEVAGMENSDEYEDNDLMGDYTVDGNDLTGASVRQAVKANLAALKRRTR